MRAERVVALSLCILMVSLSVPYYSFWNFGTGTVNAAVMNGIECPGVENGNVGAGTCEPWSESVSLFECTSYGTWDIVDSFLDANSCNTACATKYNDKCFPYAGTGISGAGTGDCTSSGGTCKAPGGVGGYYTDATECPSGQLCFFPYSTISDCNGCINFGGTWCSGQNGFCSRDGTCLAYTPTWSCTTGTGTGTGTGAIGCCIVTMGTGANVKYTYQQIQKEKCGGQFYPGACSQYHSTYCNNFCGYLDPPRVGSCIPGVVNEGQSAYGERCDGGFVCKCGDTDQSKVACESACQTGTQSGYGMYNPYTTQQGFQIPVGMCTSDPSYVYAAMGMTSTLGQSTTTYSRQPYQLPGQHGCNGNEKCWCYFISSNMFSQSTTPTTATIPPATLPGTECTPRWCPTDAIKDKPVKEPNQRACDIARNATITASFATSAQSASSDGATGTAAAPQVQVTSTKMLVAGSQLTINGKVGKLTDDCNGYTYTCRIQKEVDCKIDDNFLYSNLEYEDCPDDMPEVVHEEGGGRVWHWGRIVKLTAAAAMTAAAISPPNPQLLKAAGQLAASATMPCPGETLSPGVAMLGIAAMIGANIAANDMAKDAAAAKAETAGPLASEISTGGSGAGSGSGSGAGSGSGSGAGSTTPTGSPGSTYEAGGQTYTYTATADPTFKLTGMAAANDPYTMMMMSQMMGGTSAGCFNSSNIMMMGMMMTLQSGLGTIGGSNSSSMATSLASGANMIPNCNCERYRPCFRVCGQRYETAANYAPTCTKGGPVVAYADAMYKCGMGDCGGFSGKDVKIRVIDPNGQTAIDDSVTAGGDGAFSYTFRVPAGNGQFTAIVSTPRT